MGKPFTPERLANIRRIRKARRLYRKQPLFAFEILLTEYPNYTQDKFWDDLRCRSIRKNRKGKSPLIRYGRYRRMQQLIELYKNTQIIDYALKAQRLRRLMTVPYRVMVKIGGKAIEYNFCPLMQIEEIENIMTQLLKCLTVQDADKLIKQFKEETHIK